MHDSTATLETQQDLVCLSNHRQYRGDFLAQLIDLAGLHVTVKIEHEHTRTAGLAIVLGLQGLLDGFALRFLFFLLVLAASLALQWILDHCAHRFLMHFKTLIERSRFYSAVFACPTLPLAERHNTGKGHQKHCQQNNGLKQKLGDIENKIHNVYKLSMKWEMSCPEIEALGGVGGIALTSNQSASSISSGFNARSPDCHSAKKPSIT